MEGDLWAFLAKVLPFPKPMGLDSKTMFLLKRSLFFHLCVGGATMGGLTDFKDCCLIRPLCSCFQPWAWLTSLMADGICCLCLCI